MDPDDSNIIKNKKKLSKENLKQVGSLFKKRFHLLSENVVTNRIWLKSTHSRDCDVLIEFAPNSTYEILFTLLDKILKTNLKVIVKYHQTTHRYCFYISATYIKLLQGAEDLKLKKLIKSKFGGGNKEFIFDEQEFYENIEEPDLFLTTQEKQAIINETLNQIIVNTENDHIVLNSKKVKDGKKLIHWCLKHKIISQIVPIHDTEDLKVLRNDWVFSIFGRQPLDKIRNYFGVKLAMYFGWLGFYTRSLVIPALLGFIVWLNLNKNETHDAILFLVLCSFNLIWSIGFNQLWSQRCAEYSYKWGTLDMEEDLLQDPRPLFKGVYKPSKVTGKLEPHYPEWKRVLFRIFVTLPCLIASIFITIGVMIVIFNFQDFIANKIIDEKLPVFFGLTKFFPKMLYANLIGGFNKFYKKLCTWLNDKENYREATTHENHLILKIVLFQFINSYLSLFYIAFYLQDEKLLQAQLFAIFISKQLTGNIKESIIPYIWANMRQMKIIDRSIKEKQFSSEMNKDWTLIVEKLQHYAESYIQTQINLNDKDIDIQVEFNNDLKDENTKNNDEVSRPEVESLMSIYPDTFDDYLEMVMQFGLMIFFLPAFPLAALFSLINNFIEIRSDAFKMCLLFQRPLGQRVVNIGIWQKVLEVFSILGITVNCALLVTFQVVPKLYPDLGYYETLGLIVVIEHIFLGLNKLLVYSLPQLPKWILIEKRKLEFKRREALRQIESNEIHNLKNFKD